MQFDAPGSGGAASPPPPNTQPKPPQQTPRPFTETVTPETLRRATPQALKKIETLLSQPPNLTPAQRAVLEEARRLLKANDFTHLVEEGKLAVDPDLQRLSPGANAELERMKQNFNTFGDFLTSGISPLNPSTDSAVAGFLRDVGLGFFTGTWQARVASKLHLYPPANSGGDEPIRLTADERDAVLAAILAARLAGAPAGLVATASVPRQDLVDP